MYEFDSKIIIRGDFEPQWPEPLVKNEPMLFNCDLDSAWKLGGPITEAFLERLPKDWIDCNPIIDSRVHMLMPGWFPCIPGFHHDDVARSEAMNGQPDYDNMPYHSEHLMGLVNGDICPTEFAIGKYTMPRVNPHRDVIYRVWDEEIIAVTPEKGYVKAESGVYIQFDWQTFHQGTKAVKSGWRWFIRLSRNTARQANPTNEIRQQVQVYLDYPTMGW